MGKTGKELRMGKIFREDGRTIIVALDHGVEEGPMPGIERPLKTIKKIVEGRPDALMTNLGVINRFTKELSALPAVIWSIPSKPSSSAWVEEAVKLGVDAVKVEVFAPPKERERFEVFGPIAVECEKWGIPLLAEVVPTDPETGKAITDPKIVKKFARIGVEYGGGFLKIAYTGSAESFREVVEVCPVPVTILGGVKMETDRDVLEVVKGSIDAGGSGVAFGRNIWQNKNPAGMLQALSRIIHENASVVEAFKELK